MTWAIQHPIVKDVDTPNSNRSLLKICDCLRTTIMLSDS